METDKKSTIDDIARFAKVSKSTVSRVLNDTTPVAKAKRKAVLAAVKKLDFKPNQFARGLAGGQSMTIGIVTQNIGSPFYDSVTSGVIKGLDATGYTPLIVDGQWDVDIEKAAVQTLLGRQVDGLVIVGGSITETDLDKIRSQRPTFIVARELDDWGGSCAFVNNYQAAYDLTQYLLEQGHREIAHITGIMRHQDAIKRYDGYAAALADGGIPLDKQRIFEGNFSGQSGILAIETFLIRGARFSAVFAANDEMAFGARLALSRRNIRVPEDVSLVGFDDQPLSAFMTPPLTTVAQPALEMGIAAAQAIVQRLKNKPFNLPDFPTRLVLRESVTRLR